MPLVFHTSDHTWTTSRQLGDLFAGPDVFKPFAPRWPICFWDLAAKTPRELLDSTHAWLKALAVPRAGAEDSTHFAAVLAEAFEQLSTMRDRDQIRWYDLRHFMLSWARKLRPKEERGQILEAIRQTQPTHELRENQTMLQTISQADFAEGQEKGIEQGIERGIEQGIEQGIEKGVIIGHIQMLESLLNLPAMPIRRFQTQSLDELQQLETELKSRLVNRSTL